MNGYLRQSTASQVRTIGPFIDDGDFKTLENALTIANTDILIKKNGAASAAKNSGGATADASGGLYHLTWDATDTETVGELYGSVKVAGALVVFFSYVVLEEAVYDALFVASAPGYVVDQPVNVTKWLGTAAATPTVAGVPEVDITHLVGVAQSATDLKDFADDGYDPSTNKVQGVVLTDTLTTYTGNTPQTGDSFARIGATGSGLTTLASQASLDVVDGIVDSILVDTAEIGAAGAGLTNINLPNQTMDIVGSITGNLSGSVGSVTGAVASVTAGVTLANDAITAAKFDESTAFPLKADDSGSTAVARVNRLSVLVTKTATVQTDGGNSATQIKTDLTETATDHYKDCLVKITSGALAEQVKKCTGYNGTTKALSFTSGFTGTPADGVTVEIVNE
jgi:hypothetical protein